MNGLTGVVRSLKANRVNLASSVASRLHPDDTKGRRVLVVAREAMTREDVDRRADHVCLIIMCGPAEASIYCIGQPGVQRNDNLSIISCGISAQVWIMNKDNPSVLMLLSLSVSMLIHITRSANFSYGHAISWATWPLLSIWASTISRS
jgi:hypothetical protein